VPYNIDKKKCKQSDGDSGTHVLSYTDGEGKDHDNCHTSKKGAQGQIAAIEGDNLAETDDMVFGGGGLAADDEGEDDEGLEEALLRKLVRERLLIHHAKKMAMLREWVHLTLLTEVQANADLAGVIETVLADNAETLGYEVEQKSPKLYYTRFGSSSIRDSVLESGDLQSAITAAVKGDVDAQGVPVDPNAPPAPFPDADIGTVSLTAHSRDLMEISAGGQKIRIAFKGPSAGGTGLKFEDVLFAWISYATEPRGEHPLEADEIGRLKNTFFPDQAAAVLTDAEAQEQLYDWLSPTGQVELEGSDRAGDKLLLRLIKQAEASYAELQGNKELGTPEDVKFAGGRGIKGDLLLVFDNGEREVDLSLKAEEKAGSNNFIFNKDLGDGTKEKTLGAESTPGRTGGLQWKQNLIPAPGGVAWWQIARKNMVDKLPPGSLTAEEMEKFHTEMNGGGQANLLKVRKAIMQEKEDGGTAYKESAKAQADALVALKDSLEVLAGTNDGKRKIISLLEEAQFGSSATRELFKLTSSPSAAKAKREVSTIDSLYTGDEITDETLAKVEIPITQSKNTVTVEIIYDNKKLNELKVSGLKFRSSVFGTKASELSIKTRA
jgi:hypothetical protein